MGDTFETAHRGFVAASVGTTANCGVALGSMFSGVIGKGGSWRLPYLFASVLQALMGVVLLMCLRDKKRDREGGSGANKAGAVVAGVADHTIAWSGHSRESYQSMQIQAANYIRLDDLELHKFSDVLRVKSNFYLLLQALPGCVPVSLIMIFLPDYLISSHGMSIGGTLTVLLAYGISGMGCTFVGGSIGSYLYGHPRDKSKKMFCRFLALANILGVFPFLLLVNLSSYWVVAGGGAQNRAPPSMSRSPEIAAAHAAEAGGGGRASVLTLFLALCGGIVAVPGPNVRMALMGLNESSRRGTVFSALTLADDLGKGLGKKPFCCVRRRLKP